MFHFSFICQHFSKRRELLYITHTTHKKSQNEKLYFIVVVVVVSLGTEWNYFLLFLRNQSAVYVCFSDDGFKLNSKSKGNCLNQVYHECKILLRFEWKSFSHNFSLSRKQILYNFGKRHKIIIFCFFFWCHRSSLLRKLYLYVHLL